MPHARTEELLGRYPQHPSPRSPAPARERGARHRGGREDWPGQTTRRCERENAITRVLAGVKRLQGLRTPTHTRTTRPIISQPDHQLHASIRQSPHHSLHPSLPTSFIAISIITHSPIAISASLLSLAYSAPLTCPHSCPCPYPADPSVSSAPSWVSLCSLASIYPCSPAGAGVSEFNSPITAR